MNGAVIAALNEERTIGRLVTQLKTQGLEVCVIDDGSTDGTGKIAKEAGAFVIAHSKPLGIGKSLMDGWRYALQKGWAYTVQIDAGGSHDPLDAFLMIACCRDILIGSRFTDGSHYFGRQWRAIASLITAHLLNFATKQKITDWTSGYRVFSRKALEVLIDYQYMTNMHTWQIEVIGEAVHKGLTVTEFPITYRAGDSSMKWQTVDDLIRVYLWILNR